MLARSWAVVDAGIHGMWTLVSNPRSGPSLSLPLLRLRLHWSLALLTALLVRALQPPAHSVGSIVIATALTLATLIAHSVVLFVARRLGGDRRPAELHLFALGAAEGPGPEGGALAALAGPSVHLVVGCAALSTASLQDEALMAFGDVQLCLFLFSLLPGVPMGGLRVLVGALAGLGLRAEVSELVGSSLGLALMMWLFCWKEPVLLYGPVGLCLCGSMIATADTVVELLGRAQFGPVEEECTVVEGEPEKQLL